MSNEALEQEIKQLIIDSLMLEEIDLSRFDRDTILFGEGLGLDSVDALELGVALQKKYGIKISGKEEDVRHHFACVKNLAQFVADNKQSVA